MFEGKVRTGFFNHASFLIAPIFGLVMIVFLIGFMIQKTEWYFWLPISSLMLFLTVKSGLLPKLTAMMNPVEFTVLKDGVVSKEGVLITWPQIDEVSVFRHGGYPHLGIKLNPNLSIIDGKPPEEAFKKNENWSYYKMPIVTMSEHLVPAQVELIKIFQDYGIKVSVNETEIEPGLVEE